MQFRVALPETIKNKCSYKFITQQNVKRFSSSPQENGSGLDQSCSVNKGDTISSYVKINKIKSNQPSEAIGEATKNQARISGMKDNTMTSQIGYITMNEAITRNQNQTVTSQQNQGTNNQTSKRTKNCARQIRQHDVKC